MELERFSEMPIVGEKLVRPRLARRESHITKSIYGDIKKSMDARFPLRERNESWGKSLRNVVEKRSVRIAVNQNLRPAFFGETSIDKSHLIDDRVLESYSPALKGVVDRWETNPQAAFAILEYFLRNKYHNLTDDQAVAAARLFPAQAPGMSFETYKTNVEGMIQNQLIPGKSSEESWIMKREIMDMIEIADTIKRRYVDGKKRKTISITDLMRISAGSLRQIHQCNNLAGAVAVNKADEVMLKSPEARKYRVHNGIFERRFLTNPTFILSAVVFGRQRNIAKDMEQIAKIPSSIQIEGMENIPANGSALIAFSHMDRWKDKNVIPHWEIAKMVQAIARKRPGQELNLIAYINYLKETAPRFLKRFAPGLVDKAVARVKKVYGINLIDVAAGGSKLFNFVDDAKDALTKGQVVMLSPEGIPAMEVLKPMRGIGMLARASGAPVVGVAFREDRLPDGKFVQKVIFTPPQRYEAGQLPGRGLKDKDQAFSDSIMRSIASKLPEEQRGIFR